MTDNTLYGPDKIVDPHTGLVSATYRIPQFVKSIAGDFTSVRMTHYEYASGAMIEERWPRFYMVDENW